MSGNPLPPRLLIAFALSLLVHTLLMSSEQVHGAPMSDRDGALHDHCPTEASACIPHATIALDDPATAPRTDACGPLTPWKTSGGDGGERLERAAAPIVTFAGMIHTCPIPDDPPHRDPPDVRRAFLQVYLN